MAVLCNCDTLLSSKVSKKFVLFYKKADNLLKKNNGVILKIDRHENKN
jgi:hypothetical protein